MGLFFRDLLFIMHHVKLAIDSLAFFNVVGEQHSDVLKYLNSMNHGSKKCPFLINSTFISSNSIINRLVVVVFKTVASIHYKEKGK